MPYTCNSFPFVLRHAALANSDNRDIALVGVADNSEW